MIPRQDLPSAGLFDRVPASVRQQRFLDRLPPPTRPWIFSVEDTSIQLTWRSLEIGLLRARVHDTEIEVSSNGGPGAVTIDGLPTDTRLVLELGGEAMRNRPRRWRRQEFTTLAPPPGAELFRFATISDLHVGEVTFGFRGSMIERPVPDEAHPLRCTRAALEQLTNWGAQLVLVKGDLTHNGRTKDWNAVGRLLDDAKIPVELIPGNHDQYGSPGEPSLHDALLHLGHDITRRHESIDIPGLRLVLVDSTSKGQRRGHIGDLAAGILEELRSTDLPAFITMHHYVQRLPVPTFWPPGIASPDADAFFRDVVAAKPATMISSGHTHRHRRRHVGPLVLTEVGSPKDYPGTWAGYVVHEGGIRQVVRRVTGPDLLRWTDYTAGAALGAWGLWSPGLLHHRCFTHPWPSG